MTGLDKQNKVKKKKQDISAPSLFDGFQEGNFVINTSSSRGEVFKIGKVTKKEIETLHQYDDGSWSRYGTHSIEEWKDRDYLKININDESELESFFEEALKEAILYKPVNSDEADLSEETALTKFDKKFLVDMKTKAELIHSKQKMFQAVMASKMSELENYSRVMLTQIDNIQKIIGQIELYLGIHEEIHQLQEGPVAENNIINIRQQRLYMDEEVGITADGGIDWENIEEFDKWVIEKKNYEKLIPEEKGLVVLRIRRHDKEYGDAITNMYSNQDNRRTYFLIRNGENIYRIWANLSIGPRVFPSKDEFENKEDRNDFFFENEAKEAAFTYRQNALVLQGLIDRTQLFQPHHESLNFFKPETYENNINFIRDDELALPSGKFSYRNWKAKLNSKIKRGTRIFFSGFSYHNRDESRFLYRVYTYPSPGIYSAKYLLYDTGYGGYSKEEKGKSVGFVCHYNPKDDIWNGYEIEERKKSITFRLEYGDNEVFNYDLITLEEIEYYINSRTDRPNYLDMLPVLIGMKNNRLKELKWEKEFVKLLSGKTGCSEEQVWATINWWKHKNIWKRPIMEDDAKAVRMIEQRLKKNTEAKA